MGTTQKSCLLPLTWQGFVEEKWCDYNGHLNLAYYVVMFDFATAQLFDKLEIGKSYKENYGCSWFTAVSHVCYLSEVFAHEEVYCTTQVIGFDSKRLHYFHRMFRNADDKCVATNELLALHVDLAIRKVVKFPAERQALIESICKQHSQLSLPKQLGSHISISS